MDANVSEILTHEKDLKVFEGDGEKGDRITSSITHEKIPKSRTIRNLVFSFGIHRKWCPDTEIMVGHARKDPRIHHLSHRERTEKSAHRVEPDDIWFIFGNLESERSSKYEIIARNNKSEESIDSRKHSFPNIPSKSLHFVSVLGEESRDILHVCLDPPESRRIIGHEEDFPGSIREEFANLSYPTFARIFLCYPFCFMRKFFPGFIL